MWTLFLLIFFPSCVVLRRQFLTCFHHHFSKFARNLRNRKTETEAHFVVSPPTLYFLATWIPNLSFALEKNLCTFIKHSQISTINTVVFSDFSQRYHTAETVDGYLSHKRHQSSSISWQWLSVFFFAKFFSIKWQAEFAELELIHESYLCNVLFEVVFHAVDLK